ncbi:MAG: hypothetical protein ABFS46_18090, partial [Myxococcota bacterium]
VPAGHQPAGPALREGGAPSGAEVQEEVQTQGAPEREGGGEEQTLGVDTVVICAGQVPRRTLVEGLTVPHHLIGGADIAKESAGVTLVKGNLDGIVRARLLSQAVMGNIRQNLFFAFVYNGMGVPIAAGVLYPFFGILLNPMIAAAAMSLSSVSVITNALRLKAARLGEGSEDKP